MIGWILSANVLILAVILMRFLFSKRIGRVLQYAVWLIVFVRLILPFSLFSSPISVENAVESLISKNTETVETVEVQSDSSEYVFEEQIKKEVALKSDPVYAGPVIEAAAPAKIGTEQLLKILWACGSAVFIMWFAVSNAVFSMRLKKTRIPVSVDNCNLRVFVSKSVKSPCLFGLFSPAVYLTEAAIAHPFVDHVIEHELCHFRHLDHVWSYVRCLCLALWWWDPLVWAAAFLSRTDCELACDCSVIKKIGEEHRLSYGRTLVDMIAVKNPPLKISCAATTMVLGKRGLKHRIKTIVSRPKKWLWATILVIVTAAVCVGCTFGGPVTHVMENEKGVYLTIETDIPVYGVEWTANAKSGLADKTGKKPFKKGDRVLVTDVFEGLTEYSVAALDKQGNVIYGNLFEDVFDQDRVVDLIVNDEALVYKEPVTVTYSAACYSGKTGEVIALVSPNEDFKKLAEDIIIDATIKSTMAEAVDQSALDVYFTIQQSFSNGVVNDYYFLMGEEGAVLQGKYSENSFGAPVKAELYEALLEYFDNIEAVSETSSDTDIPDAAPPDANVDIAYTNRMFAYKQILNDPPDDINTVDANPMLVEAYKKDPQLMIMDAVCDINGDGKPELLIGAGKRGGDVKIYDLYSLNDTRDAYCAGILTGGKAELKIYEDGSMVLFGNKGRDFVKCYEFDENMLTPWMSGLIDVKKIDGEEAYLYIAHKKDEHGEHSIEKNWITNEEYEAKCAVGKKEMDIPWSVFKI